MKKKILLRCLIGAPIGVTICLIITVIVSLCIGNGEFYAAAPGLTSLCGNEITAVTVQIICSLVIGAGFGGSSVIWDLEKWSLLKQTLVHFAVIAVLSFPIAYLLYWLPHHLYGALGYIAAFILIYVIIWVSMYFSIKAKIKKMNKQLLEMQQTDK